MNKFSKQLWLVTRIWLVAVCVNALVGTLTISVYYEHGHINDALSMFMLIAFFGGLFSCPVPLVLWFVMAVAARLKINGYLLLGLLYVIGITLTVIVFSAFDKEFRDSGNNNFLWIAIGSGVAGITTFYRSIVQRGGGLNNPQ